MKRTLITLLCTFATLLSFAQYKHEYVTVYKSDGTTQYFANGKIHYSTDAGTTKQVITADGLTDSVASISGVDSMTLKTSIIVGDPVNLGLTSGTLWASNNVGASTTGSYGDYYAFGETEPKSTYIQNNYKYYSKYYGYTSIVGSDHSYSGTKYDVAAQKWGNGWVTPTATQMKELVDECTWT